MPLYIPSYLPTLFFAGLKILKKEEKNYVIQQQIKILTHFGLAFFFNMQIISIFKH